MRHASQAKVLAVFLSLSAALLAGNRLFAADKTSSSSTTTRPPYGPFSQYGAQQGLAPAHANPASQPMAILEKLKSLAQLEQAFDLAADLFSGNTISGNEADLLSKNKTALLSGNSPKILTGKSPKVLSENTIPIMSGNTFSLLSNIKVEIHIEYSGNPTVASARREGAERQPAQSQPAQRRAIPGPEPARKSSR